MNPILRRVCRPLTALVVLVATSAAGAAAPPPTPSRADLQACLQRLQPAALAAGVSKATFEQHTGTLEPDATVLAKLDYQPEFKTPVWDYLAALVDDERVSDGRAMLATHAATLAEVAKRYGVDAETVVAVWGVERGRRCRVRAGGRVSFAVNCSPRSASCKPGILRPTSLSAPGRVHSGKRNSCRARSSGWRWTLTVTAEKT
jgi:hypothetical protein